MAFTDWNIPSDPHPYDSALMITSCDAQDPDKFGDILNNYARQVGPVDRPDPDFQIRWINALQDLINLQKNLESEIGNIEMVPPETILRPPLGNPLVELLDLTEEQIKVLDLVEDDPRLVIDGAAGTGKTVLAMELAKRRCEAGNTVALLCSNPNLIHHLEPWAKQLSDGNKGEIVAGTPATLPFWAFRNDPPSEDRHQQRLDDYPELEESLKFGYLEDKWSSFVDKTVKDLGQEDIFDYLIVDEAQNLCDKVFLELMNALLKGGLTNGRFTMFGDFENQDIVTHNQEPGMDSLTAFINRDLPTEVNREPRVPTKKLTKNCRNTHQIAEKVHQLTDIPSPTLSGVYGPDVQIKYFESKEELWELLNDPSRQLDRETFPLSADYPTVQRRQEVW